MGQVIAVCDLPAREQHRRPKTIVCATHQTVQSVQLGPGGVFSPKRLSTLGSRLKTRTSPSSCSRRTLLHSVLWCGSAYFRMNLCWFEVRNRCLPDTPP